MTGSLPILVDCDEVLADFVGECLRLAAEKAGINATRAHVTGWDLAQVLGWPELNQAVDEALVKDDLCENMPEVPGALAWLRELEQTFGVDRVFICTSPWSGVWAGQRMRWLEARGIARKRLIQCSAKHLIPGHLIDDALHHIELRPQGQGFLLAAPWNAHAPAHLPRGNHADALAWLKGIAK